MNQDSPVFETTRVFDAFTFLAVLIFVILFANAMVSLLDAFQAEVYSSVVADLSSI